MRIRSQSDFLQHYMDNVADADIVLPAAQKRKLKLRDEDAFQINCIKLIRARKDLRFIVAQPDRIKSPTMWMRQFLKRLGVFGNPGHPEILILPFNPLYTTLIELKTKPGVMSTEQSEWRAWALINGYRHHVVKTLEEMEKILHGLK